MKKVISLILCALLVFMPVFPAYAENEGEGQPFTARDDGSFHILLIADTQDKNARRLKKKDMKRQCRKDHCKNHDSQRSKRDSEII